MCVLLLGRRKFALGLSGLSWGSGCWLELPWEAAAVSAFPFVPKAGEDSGASAGAADLRSAMCAGPLLFPANPQGEPGGGGVGGVAHSAERHVFSCGRDIKKKIQTP